MSARPCPSAFLLPLITLSSAPALADDSISFDRPGFSDSTSSVPAWRLAVETGAFLRTELEGDANPYVSVPQALLRFGLPAGLEARLTLPSLVIVPDAGDDPLGSGKTVGATDPGVGIKYAFSDLGDFGASVVLGLTIPLNVNDYGNDETTGQMGLNLDWTPIEAFSLALAG